MPRRYGFDRLARRMTPGFAPELVSPLVELAPGLWALEYGMRLGGSMQLPSRTTAVRLDGGDLAVISPPPLGVENAAASLEALGRVRHVIAPNSFHYLFAAGFLARHPGARFWLAPGLAERAPELPPGRTLDALPRELAAALDLAVLGPVRGVSEVVLFHRATGSAILTDLAFNVVRYRSGLERLAWQLFGIPRGFGTSRSARLTLLADRAAARACLEQVRAWPMQRIVVSHGDVIERDAPAAFVRVFAPYLD